MNLLNIFHRKRKPTVREIMHEELVRIMQGERKALQSEMGILRADVAKVKAEVAKVGASTKDSLSELAQLKQSVLSESKTRQENLSNYQLIASSKYFDCKWYRETYLSNVKGEIDSVRHYLDIGWREGNSPSSLFNGEDYFDANPDVRRAKINPLLHYLKHGLKEGRRLVPREEVSFSEQYGEPNISFSIIMPTYNRVSMIAMAIDSLLAQTYQKFELIIIDDGSTDETGAFVSTRYSEELKNGKIRYFAKENGGVCRARNFGLSKARYDWIAYLDSDNKLYPQALQVFVDAIVKQKNKSFYASWDMMSGIKSACQPFNLSNLICKNFIDLGVFVHARSLYDELGGFDENLSRLVDWELIIRYSKKYPPHYIEKSVFLYNDGKDYSRITTECALDENRNYIWEKHRPKVSVVIPVYNTAPKDIRNTIDCLLNQTLKQVEFIFVDDCGTSGAMEVVFEYMRQDDRIRVIKNEKNVGSGISRNNGMKVAAGEYLAFFDSDDICDLDFYEKLYKASNHGEFEIVKALRKNCNEKGECSDSALNTRLRDHLAHGGALYLGFTAEHTTAIYRTDYVRNHRAGYGNTYASQDTTFLLKVAFFCRKIAFIDTCAYTYFTHSYSQTNDRNEKYYFAQIDHIHQKLAFLNAVTSFDQNYYRYLAIMFNRSMLIYDESLAASSLPSVVKETYLKSLRAILPQVRNHQNLIPFLSESLKTFLNKKA